MAKNSDYFEMKGRVVEALPGAKFKVEVIGTDKVITCTLSGRLRSNYIKILVGDNVDIDVSVYDTSMGRITYRNK